jgi:hypothetical protein
MSAGSNATLLGGGLLYSLDTLEGMKGIVGVSESREDGLYEAESGWYDGAYDCVKEGAYVEGSGMRGARSGALSRMDVPLEEEGRAECGGGWYAREGGLGLSSVGKSGDLVPWKRTFNWRFRGPDSAIALETGPSAEVLRPSDGSSGDT